ncbi:uncharacterized protein LOC131682511 [Topomyia yanbarensis]|uniref:uncharacterized protein LOC131682511 n=1 Tax=Topomyia yanbarensis TaxID=2498891 RepID=UPI00273C9AEE|nr:uncharacterized protein LOC131682511 [Topomyia yanbarensis]
MEENADLARNLLNTPDAKKNSHRLWNQLKDVLNEQGPPMREVTEWKKVWADYKYKVKNKLRHNVNSVKKTGGGPNKQKLLNPYEESVVRSAGLNVAVSGIAKAKSFGCRKSLQTSAENYSDKFETFHDSSNHNPQVETGIDEEQMCLEEFLDESTDSIEVRQADQTGKDTEEESKKKTWGKRTNAKREKIELLKRYVEAKEESNKTQQAILRIKEESLEIKRKMYELELNKFALLHERSETDE